MTAERIAELRALCNQAISDQYTGEGFATSVPDGELRVLLSAWRALPELLDAIEARP